MSSTWMVTPKVSTPSIDDTVLETPVPRATSTVDRKKLDNSPSRLPDIQKQEQYPDSTRLTSAVSDINKLIEHGKKHNQSMDSVCSSLGLLGGSLSDFSVAEDEKNNIDKLISKLKVVDTIDLTTSFQNVNPETDASHLEADLRLRMQRALAVQTLERSSSVGLKPEDSSHPVSGAVDLDNALSDVSFHENRISSHSTDFSDAEDEVVNPFSNSDLAANASLQLMLSESSDFISSDEVEDRLLADEISWKKAFGSISATSNDISHFSGIAEGGEVTFGTSVLGPSSTGRKVCADEFFSLKTDKIGSLHNSKLNDSERPNFGTRICSPVSGRKRVPLVDLTTDTFDNMPLVRKSAPAAGIDAVDPILYHVSQPSESICSEVQILESEDSSDTTCSVPSVTQIERIMSEELEFSPRAFIKNIMKCGREPQNKILKDTSNIQLKELSRSKENFQDESFKSTHLISDVSYDGDSDSVIVIGSSNTNWSYLPYTEQDSSTDDVKENNSVCSSKSETNKELTRIISNKAAKSVNAQIAVFVGEQLTDSVDFGTLPELCMKCYTLTIINLTDKDLPLTVAIKESSSVGRNYYLNPCLWKEKVTSLACVLNGGRDKSMKVELGLCTPTLKQLGQTTGFVELLGKLSITLDIPDGNDLVLKHIPLRGCVGMTLLLLRNESPIDLISYGRGEAVSKILLLKNGGQVPLNLKLVIINRLALKEETDGAITIDKPQLLIAVNEEVEITVTYHPDVSVEHRLQRTLIMELQPQGQMYELVLNCISSKRMPRSSSGSGGLDRNLSDDSSRSSSASRSSKWPIVSTSKQLIWSSLSIGKSCTESCTLRNEHTSLVKLQMILHDPANAYKLLNERGEFVSERTILLHSMECLTFTVMFCPVRLGAAFAKVQLRQLPREQHGNKLAIPLCGYGGSAKVTIHHIPKDKTGHMWLSLGPLYTSMEAQFTLTNKGSLEAFAVIKFVPRGADDLMQPTVLVEPNRFVMEPGCSRTVHVTYKLHSDDIGFLAAGDWDVREIGALKIISGDEPTRHRIRRIKNNWQHVQDLKQNPKYTFLDLDTLCTNFPEESTITDVSTLSDPDISLRFLYRVLQQHEVGLTVERVEERTLVAHSGHEINNDAGDSILFQSLYSDNATFVCGSDDSDVLCRSNADGLWHVSPTSLTLMLPQFSGGCITITSNFRKEQLYEVHADDNFLMVSPTSDIIPAGGEAVVTVSCSALPQSKGQNCKSVVKILLENDVKAVMINIHNNMGPHKTNVQRHANCLRPAVTPSCKPRSGLGGITKDSSKSNLNNKIVTSKRVEAVPTTGLAPDRSRKLWR